jgi:hypothetical protein
MWLIISKACAEQFQCILDMLQVVLLANRYLYRCPFKRQRPVTGCNWLLFDCNYSLVLINEGSKIRGLSPVVDFNILSASYSSSPLKPEMPQASSGPTNEI